MAGKIKELSGKDFDDFIKKGFVLVDFFADWCMPCIMMVPIMGELSEKFYGKVKFAKVDVQENQNLASKYGVSSIPNFALFKDGEIADRFIGSMSFEEFEEKIKRNL